MTIEAFLIDYLDEELTEPVSGSVPHPMPNSFVTVEKTGSYLTDLISKATIAVQSWSTSRAAAAALNDRVVAKMMASMAETEISHCKLTSDYNYTDEETGRARYQSVFEVTYFEMEDD